jgi:hypothetical protein
MTNTSNSRLVSMLLARTLEFAGDQEENLEFRAQKYREARALRKRVLLDGVVQRDLKVGSR